MGDLVRRATLANRYGLNAEIELDYKLLKSKMQATVSRLASGIKLLLKSNGIDVIEGEGHIVSKTKIAVNQTLLDTKNIVIATRELSCLSVQTRLWGGIYCQLHLF